MKGYPGAKSAAGVWQRIVSAMPAHRVYVEGFAGSAVIARRKLPAQHTLLIDRDEEVCRQLAAAPGATVVCGDVAGILATGGVAGLPPADVLVYLDPPYLGSTRTKRYYRHELWTPAEHEQLLQWIVRLPYRVMLSGYPSRLYTRYLRTWRVETYQTMTRGGVRDECLWMNFPEGLPRHDLRYVGRGFRERERINRKRRRWVERLRGMSHDDREVIAQALAEVIGHGSRLDLSSP